ncbi:hypothetical protein G7046_g3100 [Stylonectria norvegica]|nr:hypothetical protein G7046_g3100 [Stylonectria norvegica]
MAEDDEASRQSCMVEQSRRPLDTVQYLNDREINEFLNDLDYNGDGFINYNDIGEKFDGAHDEIVLQPSAHQLLKRDDDTYDNHGFLRTMLGSGQQNISRDALAQVIRDWKIPSLQQVKKQEDEAKSYFKRLSSWRRMRAYWAVHGPEVVFVSLVIGLQVGCGVWQLLKYRKSPYIDAFGWGVTLAKTCAGALYPTFFFVVLSMSRYFSTFLRRSYYISRFLNWDLSQAFHIRISCAAFVLVVLHSLGHLTGTFLHGSRPANREAAAQIIGPGRWNYMDFVRSIPGYTGITALGLFCIIFLLSVPQVRRWNYNFFQLGHMLIYPIIGLMMAHGTAALFQKPIFGYILAFPTFLVLFERLSRIFSGFYRIKGTLEVLDSQTVEITVIIPRQRLWDFTAGQHIFLQVPAISFFQWHPFTISFCRGKKMMVHIKTDGDWTSQLRRLGSISGKSEIEVGINGPFGAPAQRFNDFKHSIVIGAGIGVTPFSAILADLQHNNDLDYGGPDHDITRHQDLETMVASDHDQFGDQSGAECLRPKEEIKADGLGINSNSFASDYRRTDFHWIVRDGNYLLWLSDLLNKVSVSQKWHRENDEQSHLDIRINTHVTAKRNNIATHIYSWLLEMHRTTEHPASPLTGLLNPTRFGRPDFNKILDEHYDDMRRLRASRIQQPKKIEGKKTPKSSSSNDHYKVGVFYCGAAAVGEMISDKCSELNIRGRSDGSKIQYYFMMEVFS